MMFDIYNNKNTAYNCVAKGKTEMSHINCLTMTRDCKIYFLVFDRLDLRCAIWPKLCLIISFLHHYENYTFLKRFKCT